MKNRQVFTLIFFMSFMFFHQESKAQITTGNVLIEPYFGFPTSNVFLGSVSTNSSSTDFRAVGPPVSFGGRVEYMLLDNLGAGIDVNYAISGYQYTWQDYYDQETQTFSDVPYVYSVKKLRAMIRMNYHFVQTSEFDVYTGFGFGYRGATRSLTIDGQESFDYPTTLLFVQTPISFRFALGTKYYFSENIGILLEAGTSGGSFMQLGIAIKM